MHRYRVIGYDAKGERLFTLRVEALTKTDARLMAMALSRRSGSGAAIADRAKNLSFATTALMNDSDTQAASHTGKRK